MLNRFLDWLGRGIQPEPQQGLFNHYDHIGPTPVGGSSEIPPQRNEVPVYDTSGENGYEDCYPKVRHLTMMKVDGSQTRVPYVVRPEAVDTWLYRHTPRAVYNYIVHLETAYAQNYKERV